jgi:PAS domain S-box-containing protein
MRALSTRSPILLESVQVAAPAIGPVLVGIGYYLGAQVAFYIGTLTQMFAPFWPPNVVLLCALLVVPERQWWKYVLAAFPAHLIAELGVEMPLPQLLLAFVCNTGVATLTAISLRRLVNGPPWLDSVRHASLYLAVAVACPAAVGLLAGFEPTLGDGNLDSYWAFWWRWSLSNVLGGLTLTPLFLAWFAAPFSWRRLIQSRSPLEAFAIGLALLATCTVALGADFDEVSSGFMPMLLCAPVPVIFAAAVRFGGRGASGAVFVVTVLSIWHAMQGHGPFAYGSPGQIVLSLQVFLIVISAPVLLIAALVEELRRSEEKFRVVAEMVPAALFTATPEFGSEYSNPRFSEYTGLSPAQLTGMRWMDALHPDDRAKVEAARREGARTGESFEIECRARGADGSYRWFAVRWRPVIDPDGTAIRWFGATIDIDDLKRSEADLRRANERLERLLANMTEYQYSIGRDWRVLECNAAAAACSGAAQEELVGRNFWEILPDERGGELERQFRLTMDCGIPTRFEAPMAGQKSLWKEYHVYPIPEGISVFATDITQRRVAELFANQTRELLQSSLDAMSAHVAILDRTGTIITVNAAWREFAESSGYSDPEAGKGLDYFAVWRAARPNCEETSIAGIKALLNGERSRFRCDYLCRCADPPRWFQLRAAVFATEAGQHVVVAHDEITEIKQSEEALRHATAQILKLQDDERRRIARELHDSTSQNLLGASLSIEQVLRSAASLAPSAQATLQQAQSLIEQSQRELRTVAYLLHPPMLEAGGLPAALGWFVEGFTARTEISVKLHVSPSLDRIGDEIEAALFRVAQEALTNVHRHAGSASASVRLSRRRAGDRSYIVLAIADNGKGMPHALIGADQHVRVGGTPGKLGVGLIGMQERLRQLNGQLKIRSGPVGTVVKATVAEPVGSTASSFD